MAIESLRSVGAGEDKRLDMSDVDAAYSGVAADTTFKIGDSIYTLEQLKDLYRQLLERGASGSDNISPNDVAKEATLEGDTKRLDDQLTAFNTAKDRLEKAQESRNKITDLPLGDTDNTEKIKKELEEAQKEVDTQKKKLQEMVKQAQDRGLNVNKYQRALGEIGGKAATTDAGGGGDVDESAGKPQPKATNGAPTGGAQPANGMPPFGFGNGAAQGYPSFSTDDFARAMLLDDYKLDALGSISKNQMEGKRIMMLFMYFARMAASGDLGAMYQFIKFISYIIAKDKAKQNIDMSVKLIQLQDASRKATELLLQAESPDGTDAKKSNDFMKLMQQTKAEEGVIATSQKLIADMMTEFGQVAEANINLTKAMQDAWGRYLRTVTSRG